MNFLKKFLNKLKMFIKKISVIDLSNLGKADPYIIFINNSQPTSKKQFITNSGSIINLVPGYRWSVKKGWMNYKNLGNLNYLSNLNRLTAKEKSYLDDLVDDFTICKPLDEIDYFFKKYPLSRNEEYFIFDDFGNNYIKPTQKTIKSSIALYKKRFLPFFQDKNFKEFFKPQAKVLEIGYESGGFSIYAMEELHCEVFGIDNGYSGLKDPHFFPSYIAKSINSNSKLSVGDITQTTEFDKDFFDIISSEAVLEHILDLPSALNEMRRVLKPNGILFHSYDPYFHQAGGHALGILDSPWLHLELSEAEYDRYLKEIRPNEYLPARNWYLNGLNRSYPEHKMLECILKHDFEIIYWNSTKLSNKKNYEMESRTFINAQRNYGNLTINDFFNNKHTFIARKKG